MLPQPEMNTTPLIDVLLVLLVLLILTMPAVTHQTSLELPHGNGAPRPATLLDIDFDGRFYWNAEPVPDLEALEQRLISHARSNPATTLRVHADRRASYDVVAQALAAAQRAQVSKIAIDPIVDD
jgi:biopolymer transport protein ExbD